MQNFKSLLILLILSITFADAAAFKINLKRNESFTDITGWINSQNLPDEADGVKQFYPQSVSIYDEKTGEIADTTAIATGIVSIKGMDANKIFLAGLVYATSNFNREQEEGFEVIDYNNNSFTILLKSTQGTNANETTYTRSLRVTAKDGCFEFEAIDIDCRYREKGVVPRTLRLEKLHPDRNKRHASLIMEFTTINSRFINEMAEYIATRNDITAPNLSMLKKGKDVAEGMNQDEVLILLGPPRDLRNSDNRSRWIYSNDFVIIFTEGIVTKIVK